MRGDELLAPKLDGASCEWCREPAIGSFPIFHKIRGKKVGKVQTGMHCFYCARHRAQAARLTGRLEEET